MTTVGLPYRFLQSGRTVLANDDAAIQALIEQVLFTMPGERVNRPDFGSLLATMVFAGNNDLLAAAAQTTAQASLQRYLGDRIAIEAVDVSAIDSILTVSVTYASRRTGARATARFDRPAG